MHPAPGSRVLACLFRPSTSTQATVASPAFTDVETDAQRVPSCGPPACPVSARVGDPCSHSPRPHLPFTPPVIRHPPVGPAPCLRRWRRPGVHGACPASWVLDTQAGSAVSPEAAVRRGPVVWDAASRPLFLSFPAEPDEAGRPSGAGHQGALVPLHWGLSTHRETELRALVTHSGEFQWRSVSADFPVLLRSVLILTVTKALPSGEREGGDARPVMRGWAGGDSSALRGGSWLGAQSTFIFRVAGNPQTRAAGRRSRLPLIPPLGTRRERLSRLL